jgi:hypothetical protein
MHKKHEIATRLAVISSTRLFGQEQWLVDREAAIKLNETLRAMGLCEQVSANTFRNTSLGNELKADLYEVFMGLSSFACALVIAELRLSRIQQASGQATKRCHYD